MAADGGKLDPMNPPLAPGTQAIEARDLKRAYGPRLALDGFSLDVPVGSVFGLLGPNGSGKSTFMAMLAAMERPRAGTLQVFGQAPKASLRAHLGTVFQEPALDPSMTALESLVLAGRLFGLSRGAATGRAQGLLSRFGLGNRARDSVSTLSGGMRRRLEVVRALLHEPDLLLLDEPATGIDPDERRLLWQSLLEGQDGRRTILLATNDLAEADAVADRVAFVRDGRVVASGTPSALKRDLGREAVRVRWATSADAEAAASSKWEGCGTITREDEEVLFTVEQAASFVPQLFALAPPTIRSVSIEPSSLQDAYFQHVGERVRAEATA